MNKTMKMNKLLILSLVITIISFSACNTDKNSPEAIQKKIAEYESQIIEIKGKIADLQNQLDTMDINSTEGKILVDFINAEQVNFTNYIDAVGSVVSDYQSNISPEANGQIEKIYVNEGDYVTKGKLLVSLKSTVSERSIREIETSLELAKTVYKKQKELWEQQIGSEIQYLQAKNNKESLEMRLETLKEQIKMTNLVAPFDGYIETIYQKQGEIASPGRQVIELINIADVKIEADISEAYVSDIHQGANAVITFPSIPGYQLSAPITMTGSVINPNNRTFKIQVNLPNKDKKLKPNLISHIKLIQTVYDSAYVVPSIIVKNDAQGRKYVYVINEKDEDMIAVKRFITTGVSYGNKTHIISGIEVGEKIINQGYNTVKNGSVVRLK